MYPVRRSRLLAPEVLSGASKRNRRTGEEGKIQSGEVTMNLGQIDYKSKVAPTGYYCHTCKKQGCKLWREYQTFADYTELVCCDCAAASQEKDVSKIDRFGRYVSDLDSISRRERRRFARQNSGPRRMHAKRIYDGKTDQIGWRVPAVPTEDGTTFWGYTSVPLSGVHWWQRLPTRVA
jgi:hypothetical protein